MSRRAAALAAAVAIAVAAPALAGCADSSAGREKVAQPATATATATAAVAEQEAAPPGTATRAGRGLDGRSASAPQTPDSRRLRRATRAMLTDNLRGLAARSAAADETYYAAGLWRGNAACFSCSVAPGMLAAVLAAEPGGSARSRAKAIATMDRLLREQLQPDGSLGATGDNEQDNDMATAMAGTYLAVAYLELARHLPAAKRRRWRGAIAGAARSLVSTLTFYINGNINIGRTGLMYLAWRATGDRALLAAYRSGLDFALNPRPPRWRGYGLKLTVKPRRHDWSDARGYLAEAAAGRPGLDPYYLTVQVQNAAILHAVAGTLRTQRLLNALTNTLLARTAPSTWQLPIGGGTRRGMPGQRIPLLSAGPATLALGGERRELAVPALSQLRVVKREFDAAVEQANRQEIVIATFAAALLAAHRDSLPHPPRTGPR